MRTNTRVLALTASVISMGLIGTSHADIWLKDPTTGCEIWSEGEAPDKEIVTWSGSCIDGKASGFGGLVVHDKQGLLLSFNGEMLKGKVDGAGALRFRNDEDGGFNRYIGEFSDHLPMGDGIFESSEGWRLEAEFDGSFDTGVGTLRIFSEKEGGNDAVIRGEFKDGELAGPALAFYETANGEAYFGEIENGAREGFGTLVHANDDTYVGEFVKGKASGVGNYESADGSDGAARGAAIGGAVGLVSGAMNDRDRKRRKKHKRKHRDRVHHHGHHGHKKHKKKRKKDKYRR